RTAAPAGWYIPTQLGRWTVWMPWYQANFIQGAIRFNASMVRPDEGFLIVPHDGPGLYSILNRDSPVWQIYFITPHPDWWQRRMIDQLERNNVNWVLLEDVRTDGHEELRFRHTHRLMWEYIAREFDVFPVDGRPPNLDALARDGVLMQDAYAPSSWTLPSHLSMMTGEPPLVHGVEYDTGTLDPATPTLAEILRGAGYRTAGVFSAPYLEPHWGF